MKTMLPKIAAIIVAYNEEILIESIINELRLQEYGGEVSVLLADGRSTDSTTYLAVKQNVKVVTAATKGKAQQMNSAAERAGDCDVLFFVHADMQLPRNVFDSIGKAINEGYDGGGFSNVFDEKNAQIKKLGTLLNFRFFDRREQSDKGIFYGDNGIFVKRTVFERLKGFREIPIMEDYDFSKRLSKQHRTLKIKDPKITVSSRRHIKAGMIRTRLEWILIRKLFKLGVSPFALAKAYKDIR